ncbi:hypothetical protein [Zobellella aerophila]|uniref:Uncharacterized protein n=1 Tax=Zobellella aerophila TaxID=870480 RepID=A0ABP6VMG5_9GAMM
MKHKLPLFALLLSALALSVIGGQMLLAGVWQYQTDLFLDDWAQKGRQPEPLAWMVAEQAAQGAVAIYPVANGDYLDRLGRVYDWQQLSEPIGSPLAKASREQAVTAYRTSLQARPNWPFSWNQLATAKLRQGELDDEFKQALEKGFNLGPWRPIAYQQTAYLGLVSWHTLNAQEQQTVTNAIHHALTHTTQSKRQTEQLLSRLQRTDLMAAGE